MKVLHFALFGHPVAHSRSPAIHRAFAAQTGLEIRYELRDVTEADFAARVRDFFAAGGAGANVTLPHKQAAFALCDEVTGRARAAGAVNTLKPLANGRLLGDNTDGTGLVRDIIHNAGFAVAGRRVLLCGAGGAARGALGPLLDENPATLVIANRTPCRAEGLADRFPGTRACGYPELAGQSFDLLINATSGSLRGELPALPGGILAEQALACDMVYAGQPTVFMNWAREQGARTVRDGRGMLVEQAAESFAVWTGRRPATADAWQALDDDAPKDG